jgi:hypothetical protein
MAYNRYVTEGKTPVDVTIGEYGDVRLLPLMLFDNDLEVTATLSAGQLLTFQEDVPVLLLERKGLKEPEKPLADRYYAKRTEEGQSLVDFVLQEYGDVRLLPLVLFDNNFAPGANLERGQRLTFREVPPESLVQDAETMDYFRRGEIRVNTHAPAPTGWWETIDGEYWETIDGDYWALQNQ